MYLPTRVPFVRSSLSFSSHSVLYPLPLQSSIGTIKAFFLFCVSVNANEKHKVYTVKVVSLVEKSDDGSLRKGCALLYTTRYRYTDSSKQYKTSLTQCNVAMTRANRFVDRFEVKREIADSIAILLATNESLHFTLRQFARACPIHPFPITVAQIQQICLADKREVSTTVWGAVFTHVYKKKKLPRRSRN